MWMRRFSMVDISPKRRYRQGGYGCRRDKTKTEHHNSSENGKAGEGGRDRSRGGSSDTSREEYAATVTLVPFHTDNHHPHNTHAPA